MHAVIAVTKCSVSAWKYVKQQLLRGPRHPGKHKSYAFSLVGMPMTGSQYVIIGVGVTSTLQAIGLKRDYHAVGLAVLPAS